MHLSEGLDWAAGQVRSDSAPIGLHISTDEAKWYSWLHVEPAGDLAIGEVIAKRDGYLLRLTGQNIARFSVEMEALRAKGVVRIRLDGADGQVTVTNGIASVESADAGHHEWTLTLEQ